MDRSRRDQASERAAGASRGDGPDRRHVQRAAADERGDRSGRGAGGPGKPPRAQTAVPAASRLTVRGKKNRRRRAPVWTRVPAPRAIADACGRALRRGLPAVIASVAVCALGAGVWLGYRFITTSDRFAIETIEVHGASRLSADDVRAALPVGRGDNVFTADLAEVGRTLRTHPWIASADVRRVLPRSLVVEIREHEATALVALDELYLVDPSGHAFKRFEPGDGAGLPAITGLDRATYLRDPDAAARTIKSALGVLARWQSAAVERPAIGEIHLERHGGITLRTYDRGAAIELGQVRDTIESLAPRLRAFDAAWAELSDAERARVRTIHVKPRNAADAGAPPDHVTVAFTKD